MATKKIISDFNNKALRVDFLEMSLTQDKFAVAPVVYNGAGYIDQDEHDALRFKLFPSSSLNVDFISDMKRQEKIRSGELYSEEYYYTLSGVAIDGAKWRADRVLISCDWNAEYPNPIVHGNLSSVARGELLPGPKCLELHFFNRVDLPVRGKEAEFTVAGWKFHVESSDNSFIVRVTSDVPLIEHFAIRVEEALRFLLAQSITPRVIVQPNRIEFRSTTLKSPLVRLGPPISRGSFAFFDRSWELFEKYLMFVIEKTEFRNWNSCTAYLHMAHESSANSLDAWAIGLGVAVEGLASLVDIEFEKKDKEKRSAEKDRLKKLQDVIVKEVSSRECLKVFTERVRGIVSGLTSVRAIDRMYWLVTNGGADQSHVESWKKIRNRGVHPARNGEIDVASIDFQLRIDELNRVTVLLYHIVFHVIGYSGPYTDYATRGFPEGNYPVKATGS